MSYERPIYNANNEKLIEKREIKEAHRNKKKMLIIVVQHKLENQEILLNLFLLDIESLL